MAFMKPEIWHTTMHVAGESVFPSKYFGKADAAKQADVDEDDVETETGWWSRLSAAGYLDCTDWSGPFETEAQAKKYCADQYDLCDKCLAALNEDYKCPECDSEETQDSTTPPPPDEAE